MAVRVCPELYQSLDAGANIIDKFLASVYSNSASIHFFFISDKFAA
jgi:hypothetical protein